MTINKYCSCRFRKEGIHCDENGDWWCNDCERIIDEIHITDGKEGLFVLNETVSKKNKVAPVIDKESGKIVIDCIKTEDIEKLAISSKNEGYFEQGIFCSCPGAIEIYEDETGIFRCKKCVKRIPKNG